MAELAHVASAAALFIGIEGGPTHYMSNYCMSLLLFSSKFYEFLFKNWIPPLENYQKEKEFEDKTELFVSRSDKYSAGALVEFPTRQYPLKPYYLDLEPFNIPTQHIVDAVKIMLNR